MTAPRNVTVTRVPTRLKTKINGKIPSAFLVSWNPLTLEQSNGPVLGYELSYKLSPSMLADDGQRTKVPIEPGTQTSYFLDELEVGQQ